MNAPRGKILSHTLWTRSFWEQSTWSPRARCSPVSTSNARLPDSRLSTSTTTCNCTCDALSEMSCVRVLRSCSSPFHRSTNQRFRPCLCTFPRTVFTPAGLPYECRHRRGPSLSACGALVAPLDSIGPKSSPLPVPDHAGDLTCESPRDGNVLYPLSRSCLFTHRPSHPALSLVKVERSNKDRGTAPTSSP